MPLVGVGSRVSPWTLQRLSDLLPSLVGDEEKLRAAESVADDLAARLVARVESGEHKPKMLLVCTCRFLARTQS